ncbi:hypothetical protein PCL1606_12160 [Pseudomonas chlororaphis]|uniref:Uncharacterized protein n=1 Tax=Pseudomonas chlororaphis TaxID=587753 RepID=A0A0D5XUB7_9PSED|nr:hypothetical protein PCL1606_12160 [Pseudomonas chlororaphis]
MPAIAVHQAHRIACIAGKPAPTKEAITIAFSVTVLILFGAFSNSVEVIFLSHLI